MISSVTTTGPDYGGSLLLFRGDEAVDHDFRRELVSQLPHLRLIALALCGRRDVADDLVGETVLRALAAETQFRPGSNFGAWVATILRRQYITSYRRGRREVLSQDVKLDPGSPVAPNQEQVVGVKEVSAALQLLSVEHRDIIVMIALANLTYEEAAEACGCPIGTIKSRLNRARYELNKVLERPIVRQTWQRRVPAV
jgi:RNA polymerase sigma-70 factor (ECF subfamily)